MKKIILTTKTQCCLILMPVFICFVFASLLFAESISDIKLDVLKQPAAKERWGRDPFVRMEDRGMKERSAKDSLPFDLKVDGIISDGQKAVAIINGGFYRKNDRVNDFLIVGIGKDHIMLEKSGKRFSLGIEKFAIERSFTKGGEK